MKRLVIIGIVLMALPAAAREYRLTLGSGGTRVADEGLLAVSDSGWIAGMDVTFLVGAADSTLVGLRVRGQSPNFDESYSTADIRARISVMDLAAVARWHHELVPWLHLFVEGEVAASQLNLSFDSTPIKADRWGVGLGAVAGLEVRTPRGMLGRRFSLALDLGGGYAWRSSFDFDDVGGANLGVLDMNGPLFRAAISANW